MSDLRRRRRLRGSRSARRRRNTVLIVMGTLAAIVGGSILVLGLTVHSVTANLRDSGATELRLGQNTRIYDRKGRLIGIVAGVTNRTEVASGAMPQVLKDATVAIEDKRFLSHEGVDYYRLLGAAVRDIQRGSADQGGSTITMQLMKNLYEPQADRTFTQKIEEAYLAVQYEKRHTKDEILAKYLNTVFYGQNAVGVQAASLTYFSRPVGRLSLPQAALLAGLPQAPSSYNPFSDQEAARTRRNLVLDQMAEQGYITRARADQAKQAGLGLKRGNPYGARREEYFFEYVRQQLVRRYGEKQVQLGGFKVYTTIDLDLQQKARDAISANLYDPDDPASAIVMVDTQNGYIHAMASNQRFSQSQYNVASQALRQAGSTFKTFVLTEAINQGINPNSTVYDSKALDFDDPKWGPIDVSTYSGTYRGPTSVLAGTLGSDNSVYTQLTIDVGPSEVVDTAYDMGVPKGRDLPRYPSVGLGSGTVTPLDMATAYAPLSNGGFRITPTAIARVVEPDGTTETFRPGRRKVLTDGVTAEVTKILERNVQGGTGTAARISGPVAGKTGTTDNFVDAWFVGYTPRFSTAVWMGYPNVTEQRFMTSVHGVSVAGGTFPARIWGDFMEQVGEEYPNTGSFPAVTEPVEWKPFSSPFTRAAAEAAREKAEEEAERKRLEEEERMRTTTEPETTTAPPDPSQPPPAPPDPTPTPNPTPAPPIPDPVPPPTPPPAPPAAPPPTP